MPFMSSPVAYPPTSSPRHESPRKRRKVGAPRQPLHDVVPNTAGQTISGFLLDDSDQEDEEQTIPELQKSRLSIRQTSWPTEIEQRRLPPDDDEHVPTIEELEAQNEASNGAQTNHFEAFDTCLRNTQPSGTPASFSQPPSSASRVKASSCTGKVHNLYTRRKQAHQTYEEIVGERSTTTAGYARKSYYGIDIHSLVEEAKTKLAARKTLQDEPAEVSVVTTLDPGEPTKKTLLWTEKYRARKFTDLVGDERTHRSVLRWLKAWDPIVFPGAAKPKQKPRQSDTPLQEERVLKKVLLLTGPPGLGKTTLAHVCAKQAGYEVQEINASDERSRDVVKGRIRDMVGTENVRSVDRGGVGKTKKAARPVCVVVDEVDGVVSGNNASGGEGGFIKALADLLALDQKTSSGVARAANADGKRRKKGDTFRLLRPLILICNDVYHPALRLLRQGTMAEIVYVRKPALSMLVPRMQAIFEKEGVPCDSDGVRQLCEAAWGISNRKEDKAAGGTSDGDVRGVLVVAEWVASKIKTASASSPVQARLTKRWIEENMLKDLGHGGGATRSLGRGGSKEIVERVFTHNAGFPAGPSAPTKIQCTSTIALTASETLKQRNIDRLRELVDGSGEDDRIISDCFTTYPTLPFQDDTFLSKPSATSSWLHFHDALSTRVFSNQDWELGGYLSTPVLGFHHLFASTSRHSYASSNKAFGTDAEEKDEPAPFAGPRAGYEAHEATKANLAALQHLHGQLSLSLTRAFRSPAHVSTELLPYLLRMLSPDVKPVVVGESEKGVASVRRGVEKEMVRRAVDAMVACGITFERSRVDAGDAGSGVTGGFVYRMEPGLDSLGVFETLGMQGAKVRYAVRQVLEQEYKREVMKREGEASIRRMRGQDSNVELCDAVGADADEKKNLPLKAAKSSVKYDFFGRPIVQTDTSGNGIADDATGRPPKSSNKEQTEGARVWVSYHEGFSNAVKKGVTMKELLEGL